jgi:hypothetical protein
MVTTAENIQEALSQLSQTQKPREKPSFGIAQAVGEAVPKIRQRIQQIEKQIPETEKPLRLTMQWHLQGKLTYSAKSLQDGTTKVQIKIMLPSPESPDEKEAVEHPKEEHEFAIELSPEDFTSIEPFKRNMRVRIFDFVLSHFSNGNGLGDGDPERINEMAEKIFETFCK